MNQETLKFRVTRLDARVAEGVPVEWQGRQLCSGPLTIELDPDQPASAGTLDYGRRRARAEFHVVLKFTEFSNSLTDLGADPALAEPVRAVLLSEGDILEDHGFALSGACRLLPHALLAKAAARVLPGH